MIQVIIPTYNRPKCIELLLRDCINIYQGELFKFVLLDSSTNDDTKALAENSEKIEYKRFDPTVPMDDKVIGAMMDCCEEYYWLLGDGNLVDFNSFEKLIGIISDFDVLEVDSVHSKRNTNSIQESFEINNDLINYIRDRYSHLTYWGASIVRTSSAQELFLSGVMDKYRKDSICWWTPAMICEMIASDMGNEIETKILSIYTKLFYSNPEKKDRSWAKGESYFVTTFRVFDKDVFMLPECFEAVKNDIIRIFRDDVLANRSYLIHLKRRGVIKLKYVLKYKDDIQDIKGYFPFMFVLACIPKPCIEIAYKIHKLLKGGRQ